MGGYHETDFLSNELTDHHVGMGTALGIVERWETSEAQRDHIKLQIGKSYPYRFIFRGKYKEMVKYGMITEVRDLEKEAYDDLRKEALQWINSGEIKWNWSTYEENLGTEHKIDSVMKIIYCVGALLVLKDLRSNEFLTIKRKPVEKVQAYKYDCDRGNFRLWVRSFPDGVDPEFIDDPDRVIIANSKGKLMAQPGEWVVRHAPGEFYVIKADVFDRNFHKST